MSGMPPVYVLSTGRCGSTLVAGLLPAAGGKGLSHQLPGSRLVNVLGTLAASRRLPVTAAASVTRWFPGLHFHRATADPLRSMLLTALLETGRAPAGARVIHLVRDPRDFVTSFMRWKRSSMKRTILHHAVPAWQPNPWLTGDAGPGGWALMGKFEQFCWIWEWKNARFAALERSHSYKRVRLEDLTAPGGAERMLVELAEFVGVETPKHDGAEPRAIERVNASRGRFPRWREWSPHRARVLQKHCGARMQAYGYGEEPEWSALLGAAAPGTGER